MWHSQAIIENIYRTYQVEAPPASTFGGARARVRCKGNI